jgi:hypothetical protein
MTPRTDVDWIDVDASDEEIRRQLVETPHTRLPVAQGSVDHLLGVVQARDIAAAMAEGRPLDLRSLLRQAPVVADQIDALDTLAALRSADVPMAFVHDEYGISTAWSRPPTCWRLWPARSRRTRISIPIRRSSSARTAAGGCRARFRRTRSPTARHRPAGGP